MKSGAYVFLYVLCTVVFTVSPIAYAVPANTLIQNMVTVDYQVDGYTFTEDSNIASFYVDEIILFTLIANNAAGLLAASPQFKAAVSYTLTNQGNGTETFTLSESQSLADDFNSVNTKIYLDINNNNIYDDGVDVLYSVGSNDPTLLAGTSANFFIVSDIPGGLAASEEADISLIATSKTGAGPSGTIYPGAGDGGVDAVMGPQGGFVSAENKLIVTSALSQLTKTQTIVDPFGTSNAVKDAIITYALQLEITGSGTLTNIVIKDVIPAGTTYQVGSIELNGALLTDAVDGDAGRFDGSDVQVDLPSVAAPSTQLVKFSVKVQ